MIDTKAIAERTAQTVLQGSWSILPSQAREAATKLIQQSIDEAVAAQHAEIEIRNKCDDSLRTWVTSVLGEPWEGHTADAGMILGSEIERLRSENERLRAILEDWTDWRPGVGIIAHQKPVHGSCCTCQTFGNCHDDCVCEHNEIERAMQSASAKNTP